MVEDKKVFLEKVDTLYNVADSLTKFVNIDNLSWCREYMSIDTPSLWIYEYMTHWYAKKKNVGECWYVLYYLYVWGGDTPVSIMPENPSGTFTQIGQ